ncbi:alpha-1,2-fucosyltransferase [Pseudovibrio sp. SPO723]|uniref:alpha-1,2-fucosyltransferase n=1 Tax=Nesiotobacter zosterae TaxID=392721 RepID=UPI0029C4D1E1|nr:alpha-1,2-fucosyltransferase [Pseudovibrio sp. SPO723]MDX5593037.1 alpha-1,2-fucosyltransferase [Pseudovibrio sp. SPO723]
MSLLADHTMKRPGKATGPYIIVRLRGGIGNQFFQYAIGRKAALETGSQLRFDITEYSLYPERRYALEHFNVAGDVAQHEECASVLWPAKEFGRTAQLLRKVYPFYKSRCAHEKDWAYAPDAPRISRNTYLDGYFQRALIPLSIQNTLRRDLSLKRPFALSRQKTLSHIERARSVSLHIRRGDYLKPQNLASYGLCSPDYYLEAKKRMEQDMPGAQFFVFTDDPCWAKDFFKTSGNLRVLEPQPDGKDHEDLMLMSRCQHHIIANSSFSWWAAFLNPSKEKRVIAPKQWFKAANQGADHLMLPSWILL